MKDQDCVQFLQWALPRLRMRWPGFRKVRKQVCKRVERRMRALELADVAAYRSYLERHGEEWEVLDGLCRVTVSRFYRDQGVVGFIEREVLPALAREALGRGDRTLKIWSAGGGAGEEPHTVALLWHLAVAPQFPALGVRILATDSEPGLLRRAEEACYTSSSLRELPEAWRRAAFVERAGRHCLRPEYREGVEFRCHDLRRGIPNGPFHLILCRNLAFTYWDHSLQLEVAVRLRDALHPGGALVVGVHEELPEGLEGLTTWSPRSAVYRKRRTDA